MPETEDDQYYTDQEIRKLVEQLNALTDEWRQWTWVRARKEHRDLFGNAIRPGTDYLRREYGPAPHENVKVSHRSMSRMLQALIGGNPRLQMISDYLRQRIERDRDQAMKKALKSLRPRCHR